MQAEELKGYGLVFPSVSWTPMLHIYRIGSFRNRIRVRSAFVIQILPEWHSNFIKSEFYYNHPHRRLIYSAESAQRFELLTNKDKSVTEPKYEKTILPHILVHLQSICLAAASSARNFRT